MTTALFQEPETPPDAETRGMEDPDAPTVEAPYGWTVDPKTGERRPKKTAGRRPKGEPAPAVPSAGTPPLEELKARAGAGAVPPKAEDVAPVHSHRHAFNLKKKPAPPKEPEPVPPFRAGPIAKGVNKLYRRAGKIVRIWDPEVGMAIIACTVSVEGDDDDLTVGAAWEEIARTNPRIRAFLLKFITMGAWNALVIAHAPILMAICLKDGVRAKIPFLKLADAFLTDEDGTGQEFPSGMAQSLGGINPNDLAQMAEMLQATMGQMATHMPRGMNDVRDAQEAG